MPSCHLTHARHTVMTPLEYSLHRLLLYSPFPVKMSARREAAAKCQMNNKISLTISPKVSSSFASARNKPTVNGSKKQRLGRRCNSDKGLQYVELYFSSFLYFCCYHWNKRQIQVSDIFIIFLPAARTSKSELCRGYFLSCLVGMSVFLYVEHVYSCPKTDPLVWFQKFPCTFETNISPISRKIYDLKSLHWSCRNVKYSLPSAATHVIDLINFQDSFFDGYDFTPAPDRSLC